MKLYKIKKEIKWFRARTNGRPARQAGSQRASQASSLAPTQLASQPAIQAVSQPAHFSPIKHSPDGCSPQPSPTPCPA